MKDALELFSSRFSPPSPTEGGAVAISSLTGAADAFLALALTKGSRLVLAATPGLPDADRLSDDLRVLSAAIPSAREVRVLEFPPPLAGDVGALGTRFARLGSLQNASPACAAVMAKLGYLSDVRKPSRAWSRTRAPRAIGRRGDFKP